MVLIVLAAIIALRLILLYWGFFYDGFLVPPGDDAANHILLIQDILKTNNFFTLGSSYPFGYHGLIALIARIGSIDPVKLVTLSGPVLVILPIIATYFFANRWFGKATGLIAAALVGLAGAGPIFAYGDGNYPNLLGSGFLMVLALSFLVSALREKPLQNSIIGIVLLLLLALTHHLSFFIFILIGLSYLVMLVSAHLVLRRSLFNLPKTIKVVLGGFLAALLVGFGLYGKTLTFFISSQVTGAGPNYLTSYFKTPINLGQYPETVGSLVWIAGILGILVMSLIDRTKPWERRYFVIIWAVALFVASRLAVLGVPGRLARELTIPLAIAGGYFGSWLVTQANERIHKMIGSGLIAGLIVLNTVMLFSAPFTLPEGFSRLIWFWPEDQQKLEVLQGLPAGARIVATPSSPYYAVFLKDKFLTIDKEVANNEYLFIGNKPRNNPDGEVYPYFSQFDGIKKNLQKFTLVKTIHHFSDGAEIRQVDFP